MGSKKAATVDPQIAIRKQQEQEAAQAASDAQAAQAKAAADEAGRVKAERDKAIQGGESAADIAARQTSTMANPVKQRVKGRRSLVSGAIGSGVSAGREQLG